MDVYLLLFLRPRSKDWFCVRPGEKSAVMQVRVVVVRYCG